MASKYKNAFDLKGKVALVTGGNGGIGLGMARGLAAHGAKIVVAARNHEKNESAVAELRALGTDAEALSVDITDESSCLVLVATTLQLFGRIDVLVNNAGTNVRKPPEEITLDEWRLVQDTNLTSAFILSKAVYHHMKAQGGGKIINTGSMMSMFGSSFAAAYAASKGGIVQLTKSLALSWAPANIQVNAVLPGWITTELTERAQTEVPGLFERVLSRIPTGRWGDWDDLAGIAVFLASSASDYVTGTAIPVDGGFAAQG
jgi:2-deoxy-D-gluconate 3-dehydrogenase